MKDSVCISICVYLTYYVQNTIIYALCVHYLFELHKNLGTRYFTTFFFFKETQVRQIIYDHLSSKL